MAYLVLSKSMRLAARKYRARSILLMTGLCIVSILSNPLRAANGPATTDAATRIASHLDAGEFGAAVSAAAGITDTTQQSTLLQTIAAAQRAAGEPITAARQRDRQGTMDGRLAGRATYGGGGSMPNFQSLIQIIQQNTSGEWQSGTGNGGAITQNPSGVQVAPNGLLHRLTNAEQNGALTSLGTQARKADLNADVARRSELRFVSLTRLEKAVSERLSEGLSIPETMAQLAGLSQVRYVIVLPETHEVVIGGPAGAWEYDAQGQPLTSSTGRPTLKLDDLVTVLRTFARTDADFGCSINTREAGVRALMDFVEKSQAKGAINSKSVRNWVDRLQQKLGRQDIHIWGIPSDSHVARVIVEADYRMKLIGIDKGNAAKETPSYFDLLAVSPESNSKNAHQMEALRWWLTMKYDALTHSADKTVYEIQGSSVLCQSENQFLTAEGKNVPTGQSEPTNRQFAEQFTAHYNKLSARDAVFAELQNIFDLALVSALIHHDRLHDKAGWDLGAFQPDGDYVPTSYAVPKEVDSVINHRIYNDRDIIVQVAGGVRANLFSVVNDPQINHESPRLSQLAKSARAIDPAPGRWWWDATK